MVDFETVYKKLNAAQRKAVDYIDGPLLVIAGPGTGKTELLSARVANILDKTDTPPQNILCLTFTENGAENMRERLSRLIGQSAYNVTISTYHAFGREIIQRFPEYFTETRLQNSVDELGQRQIITEIVENMRYSNPLKQTHHHEGDLIATISEVKRGMLSAEDLRLIAAENLQFIRNVGRELGRVLDGFSRVPRLAEALPIFARIQEALLAQAPEQSVNPRYGSLAQAAIVSLKLALDAAEESGKTTSLTEWKNDWLIRGSDGTFIFDGELASQRVAALADVLDQYQAALATRGLYDYDDMILRAIDALSRHDELRARLQERYLYILLDEFQDTNAAQFQLVQLLTNNPVNEGRPNVMAVGDDDQAIYAFQGAIYSNMLDFYHSYRDTKVISLTENYRSQADIVATARNVSDQIAERLHGHFDGVTKELTPANPDLPKRADITRCEFLSDIAQADWVARSIKAKVEAGTHPSEIAVLAPRHKQLEPLIPYLNALGLPVRYEKRENILDAPVVKQLITMSRLVLALHNHDEATADHLWPEVLSYDFWDLSTSSIWEMSWNVADAQRGELTASGLSTMTWSRALLADGQRFRIPALLFLRLGNIVGQETGETMLDYLIGSAKVDTKEADLPQIFSPLRDYYTSGEMRDTQPELFYETLSHLTVLRARLREHQQASEAALSLQDMIDFVDMYQAADERMVNTSPYNQSADAVQVMTVFKAKGLEFSDVYLLSLQDDIWGNSSRAQANRITLPPNLAPIRHAGASEDERLRILYVAITRARTGLHLTSVAQNYSGRATKRLKYLNEQEQPDDSFRDLILPSYAQNVERTESLPPTIDLLELDWRHRHIAGTHRADLRALLEPRMRPYKLSPTHLGEFLDVQYAGPERFFFTTILRFPEDPTTDIQFGNAIHETLQWAQEVVNLHHSLPSVSEALEYFAARMRAKKLSEPRTELEIERGETALAAYLTARASQFKPGNRSEMSFRSEGVMLGKAELTGIVDNMEIDLKHKTIRVLDYKTGKSFSRWQQDARLYRYRRQLYMYKLLIENSISYAGYTVQSASLEFVEPDATGRINSLELEFNSSEMDRVKRLIAAMWRHVMDFNFPSTQSYDPTLAGIKQFEDDLIAGNI